mmetsp:Transcript_35182/g.74875  ORF Transcript_35182/g.74875 Transcript_35182/m.74875 type:complete len:366 (-) Transcript_35182:98-1195(-)
MVAKNATKRAAAKAPAAAPAQKKAKVDPNCRGVLEALRMTELPPSVKDMLEATAPKAFETASEERHFTQKAIVNMIGDAVEGVVAKFQEGVSAAAKEVEASEEKRASLAQVEEKHTTAVTEALEKSNAAKSLLKELKEGLAAAKAALIESQEAQTKGDADLNKAKEDKASLESLMSSSLTPILEGSGDLAEHFQKIKTPFLEGLALDASLRDALPSSCQKKADARGGFDNMVLQQMRIHFEERFQSLRSTVEAGEPAAQERASLVATKEAEVAEATKKVEEAARAVEEAENVGTVAAAQLDEAQAALKDHMVKHNELVKLMEQKSEELENFKDYNVACFELLKTKSATPTTSTTTTSTTAVSGGA